MTGLKMTDITIEENLTSMTETELLKLLDEWKGAGAYSITGDIIRELRQRRLKTNGNKKQKSLKRG